MDVFLFFGLLSLTYILTRTLKKKKSYFSKNKSRLGACEVFLGYMVPASNGCAINIQLLVFLRIHQKCLSVAFGLVC